MRSTKSWSVLHSELFRAVSFKTRAKLLPTQIIHTLFIEQGLLIKNVGLTPEISSVREFIEPSQALISSGTLTVFTSPSCPHQQTSSATLHTASAPI